MCIIGFLKEQSGIYKNFTRSEKIAEFIELLSTNSDLLY